GARRCTYGEPLAELLRHTRHDRCPSIIACDQHCTWQLEAREVPRELLTARGYRNELLGGTIPARPRDQVAGVISHIALNPIETQRAKHAECGEVSSENEYG